MKKKANNSIENDTLPKKLKLEKKKMPILPGKVTKSVKNDTKTKKSPNKQSVQSKNEVIEEPQNEVTKKKPIAKTSKFSKRSGSQNAKAGKGWKDKKGFVKDKSKGLQGMPQEKVEDWNEFKKKKLELKLKRLQAKNKDIYDIIKQAKQLGEQLRKKKLKDDQRNIIINQLHNLLKGKYATIVLAHDTARIIQWLLKYSSEIVINQISKELIPATVDMLKSKYAVHCVKRLLKYGQSDIRSGVIDAMQGNAVKLTSHSVSSPVVEYAICTWATPQQKQFLIQEFYGGLYTTSKDKNVKHIRDVYAENTNMKAATLSATKSNLQRILNKNLLDSTLVQLILCQFLEECSAEDKGELISQLAPHIVVISNSKSGSRAAMQCIWHGTNKDRKVIMKALKEHLVDLSKHEYGHCTILTLLDSADDTVLLHKIILSQILEKAKELAVSEWGRKVLLWLVAPANTTIFHPVFLNELKVGRESSTSKKSPDIRQKEILSYSIDALLDLVSHDTGFWLSNGSLAMEMLALIKAGSGEKLQETLKNIVDIIVNKDWKVKDGEKEVLGIEHSGLHMALKKLAQHDEVARANNNPTFGDSLVEKLSKDVLDVWVKINRGCFLLVTVFEKNSEDTQQKIRKLLKKFVRVLESQNSQGAKILLNKLQT